MRKNGCKNAKDKKKNRFRKRTHESLRKESRRVAVFSLIPESLLEYRFCIRVFKDGK
ncbi:hypothetical protein LEP1GSC133_1316 [Leptospira borgpetersenii serovar Pomona str. 200901868]|uniref:Uncharacterized protein n=3 Tax=Leptospira borgpetersenii TaxID=174 RepID=M3GXS1_LEPBO|nr:hypothetical protein LBBP_00059 [Leptospira borgpetersenii serovar Ballum]EKR01579.1 hypothetical protein LEP1GSC121_0325 [Leptospira borgpetersenii serovar Castellonis str. 200801910]EMF99628.1 hypothetical protein LEP1GSC123_2147 [Leptospira borgpetersenii str. 200701203]EMO61276.1 hypothetical protein LEP1GSC133_1316 [Leptospira borgpetersenii serovar Pomona str. 200901868]